MSAPALDAEVHRRVLDMPVDALASERVVDSVTEIVAVVAPMLGTAQRHELVARVVDRLRGLGPLEPLLALDGVTDVMVNGPGSVWIERHGELQRTDVVLERPIIEHLVERIVAPLGRRLDRTSPLVDARLPDGSRVHVVAPPIAVDGPVITIRRFQVTSVPIEAMATPGSASLLRWAVAARSNIVVVGGTSAGKTTLLNSLAATAGLGERLITIEDAAELRLEAEHVVSLEARPASMDGPPPVTIRDLVRNALRMRPDRIIVGEVRGAEAADMLQAMNTGHEGSLSTVHANSPLDALRRLETMVAGADTALPSSAMRAQLVAAVDLLVEVERSSGGARRVVSIAEPLAGAELAVRELADHRGLRALPCRAIRRRSAAPADPHWVEVPT